MAGAMGRSGSFAPRRGSALNRWPCTLLAFIFAVDVESTHAFYHEPLGLGTMFAGTLALVAAWLYLATCEIAGAVGLVAGIWWWPLGAAAAIGLLLYFFGAVLSHLRVGDFKGIGPAASLLTLSVGALCLRLLTNTRPS